MERYDSYKDSGVDWLGEIPAHWELKRNKFLFAECNEVVGKNASDFLLLSLTLRGVIPRDMENPKGKFPAEFDTYKIVAPNDLIFCLFDIEETPRTVGRALHHGMITGAYTVVKCFPGVSSAYLNYYYLSLDQEKRLQPLYTGLRKVIQRGTFFGMLTPFPPSAEQERIVAFLDQKTAEIDTAIAKKERLIELLQEQKSILINQAVTRGLNHDVPLRDSGVEWIGQIPTHWEVKPLKHLLRSPLKYGANEEARDEDRSNPRYIRITDFGDNGELRDESFKSLPWKKAKEYLLEDGDLLFARSGATVGKTFLFSGYAGGACFAGYLIKASTQRQRIAPKFLYYFTKSSSFSRWKDEAFSKATIQNIGADKYGVLSIPVPPMSEQGEILARVDRLSEVFGAMIHTVESEISALGELKLVLIASAVTGKIKV